VCLRGRVGTIYKLSMTLCLILMQQMASFGSIERYGWLGLQRYYPLNMSVLLIAYSVTVFLCKCFYICIRYSTLLCNYFSFNFTLAYCFVAFLSALNSNFIFFIKDRTRSTRQKQ